MTQKKTCQECFLDFDLKDNDTWDGFCSDECLTAYDEAFADDFETEDDLIEEE